MPLIYPAVDTLSKKPLPGDGECIAIVKELVPGLVGLPTSSWREGRAVKDVPSLARGTAIATFFNGKFPHQNTGQHAALFLSQAGAGIWVMDQWKDRDMIKRRYIGVPRNHARRANGTFPDASNNALAFSVIER